MGVLTSVYGGVSRQSPSQSLSVFDRPELFGTQLESYKGKVILVVNTATKCGFARQYDALESLHGTYASHGLVVLGFPSNDFLSQEPGSDAEIASVCRINHGVSFRLFPKAPVTGPDKQPLFKFLTEHGPADLRGSVRWNFEKFLIDRAGHLVGRWRSYVRPGSSSVIRAIEREISANP